MIEDPESIEDYNMKEIVIFKRHLKINIDGNIDEDKLIEILEDLVAAKECEIHYDEKGEQNNVAVKVTLL